MSRVRGTAWKGRPEKVTALYAKAYRSLSKYLSTAGHEQPGGNLGRPFSKAKYYSLTDSELVPRGKGEKNPG